MLLSLRYGQTSLTVSYVISSNRRAGVFMCLPVTLELESLLCQRCLGQNITLTLYITDYCQKGWYIPSVGVTSSPSLALITLYSDGCRVTRLPFSPITLWLISNGTICILSPFYHKPLHVVVVLVRCLLFFVLKQLWCFIADSINKSDSYQHQGWINNHIHIYVHYVDQVFVISLCYVM